MIYRLQRFKNLNGLENKSFSSPNVGIFLQKFQNMITNIIIEFFSIKNRFRKTTTVDFSAASALLKIIICQQDRFIYHVHQKS